MVNFFQAMAQAVRDGRLPEGQELDIETSRRGDALGWSGLSAAEQHAMVQAVRLLFTAHHGRIIKYSPILSGVDTYYRPLACATEAVITTMLSGDQALHTFEDTGSSCSWQHVFAENEGISHVTIIGLDELQRKRSRSRSRSSSTAASRKRKRSPAPASRHHTLTRPKYARQHAVGFFPFLLSKLAARFIDLDYAQIYSHEMSQFKSKQCLISSLEFYQVDVSILSHIARSFQNFAVHVPKKCLKFVAEQCQVSLTTTYYRNDMDVGTTVHKAHVPGGRPLALAVLFDHIFPDTDLTCSMFYIRNMEQIGAMVDAGTIDAERVFHVSRIVDGRARYSEEAPTMKTSKAVKALYKAGHFAQRVAPQMQIDSKAHAVSDVQLDTANFALSQRVWGYRPVECREASSDVEDEVDDIESKGNRVTQRDSTYIYFAADFESFVQGDAHEACMAGLMELDLESKAVDEDPSHVHLFEGKSVTFDLFNMVVMIIRAKEHAMGEKLTHKIVYFHNLKYDRTLFEKNPHVQIVGVCDKDTAIYSMKIRFMGCLFQVRDSAKLIPLPIKQFASNFNLSASLQKKDFSVYTYFAPENARDDFTCTPRQYVSSRVFDGDRAIDDQERRHYTDNLLLYLRTLQGTPIMCSGACCQEGKFHPWLLYKEYLRFDVLILAAGLLTFRREMHHITDNQLDALQSLTLPSFANRYMGHNGAFDDMYELSGELRAYQGQAVAGGRVFVSHKAEGRYLQGKFSYLDAVGLYPSAIVYQCEQLGGFPTGPCQILEADQLTYAFLCAETTEYTVTVEITAIRKKQRDIPFIKINRKDSMDYINDLPDGKPFKTTVDRVTLEDWIEFHKIEFTVLQGMYWTGQRNTAFGSIQRKIHSERAIAKKAGEVARSNLYKLIGNSAYGKLLQKTSATDKLMIPCTAEREGARVETNYRLTLYNNMHLLKCFRFVGEHQIEATRFKMDDSFTLAHIGSQVLAASKRLMNRVFDMASDMGLNLYYTDTDSFVCDHAAVPSLATAFAVRYGFPLLGTDMMTFHSDFTFKLPNGKALDPERVYSTDFWPMGKKLYCHRLEGETEEGEMVHSIQFKAKGVTHEGLVYKAREYGEGDEGVLGFYMNLSMGEDIEVPLNPPGVTRFVYDKDNRVSTHAKIFTRNLRSNAAQTRVATERKEEKELADALEKEPPLLSSSCPECEYERVTGDVQSQHKHTCHRVIDALDNYEARRDEEDVELEGGFCR